MNKLDRACPPFWDQELIRFLLVGVSNTTVSYLVFLLGYHILFVGDTLISQPLSYSIGIAWSYFWNRKWTFQSSAVVKSEFLRFLIVQIALLFLSTALIYYAVDWWNIDASICWIFVMLLITALNFMLTKRYVFKIDPRQLASTTSVFRYNQLVGTKMNNSTISNQFGLVVFCVGSLVAILSIALTVDGLGPIDDHQFIRTIFQGKDFGFYMSLELGRFFPLTAQEYVFTAKAFEPSPILFHVVSGIKILLCGLLLFYCLILTKAGNWAVAILWGVVIFSIGFANAAIRLHIGELNILILILIFVWSVLVSEKLTPLLLSTKLNFAVVTIGLFAMAAAFLYKELSFVFALAFGVSELFRFHRQTQAKIPRRIWALLIIGTCYIVFYGLWRAIYVTGSYANFHSTVIWEVIRFYAVNDPFIIFIVLPLTAYRILLCMRDANKQSVYDSFLVAACAYVGAYLALRMYTNYYLLPAYGFAVCGVAGILATQPAIRINTAVLVVAGFLGVNNLPAAVSDMQALKSIANNHYRFVRFLSEWLWANPLPNSERRNLVLEGVSPGTGVEFLVSLKTFLVSLGTPESSFEVKATEPSDNKNLSDFHGFKGEHGYKPEINDLLIFNPYQKVRVWPPLSAPSYKEIYRSGSEWVMPSWTAGQWIDLCLMHRAECTASVSGSMRYTGYAAMLVTREPVLLTELKPVNTPTYRLGTLNMPVRMKSGTIRKLDVLVQNTGAETWPADGTLHTGMFVNLSYRWFDRNNQVVLEGDRAPFPEPMRSKDLAKVSISLKTPVQPGKYKLVISPVQEGGLWFISVDGREIEVY